MIATYMPVSLVFVQMCYGRIFILLWVFLLCPHCIKHVKELYNKDLTDRYENLRRYRFLPSESGAFPTERLAIALFTSSRVGRTAIHCFTSICGRRLIASLLIVEGRLRTSSKCSFHLSRTFPLSVMKCSPFASSE